MKCITEVLPDIHGQLWVTVGEETLRVQLHPLRGGTCLLPLSIARVFTEVRVTPDGLALDWPGGFQLSLKLILCREDTPWLTHLGAVAPGARYRPLLPLLKHATPGATLRTQPTRVQVIRAFGMREGELESIFWSYPVPEDRMLHRLYDLGLFLRHHLFEEVLAAFLRRPWAHAVHRAPTEQHLHTLLACLRWGRLDLAEDPCWALAQAELKSW